MTDGYQELLECGCGPIVDMAMKCEAVFATHTKALVSVSGGADSDVMLDLCERVRQLQPIDITYAWFNTGLEYRATRDHLRDLEERYGIEIERHRATKSIPVSCREYGQPFFSKFVSCQIEALQRIGFQWEDEPFDVLFDKYDNRNKSAIRWWCNDFTSTEHASRFDIGRVRYLKEFIIENPPWFNISAKCCYHAKKSVSHQIVRSKGADVNLIGVRKAEGGIRATHNKCFDHSNGIDTYRPLFWLSDKDKKQYIQLCDIRHSDCYMVWGFDRTGCVGCPLNRRVFADIDIVGIYEPSIAKAANKVFADSYEYTQMFKEFRQRMKSDERGQMSLF